ncbi:MAG: hypothetical protein JWQ09_596 [Segetibacter sp.]|nr:hypothetical protein [Segetibacter sp.]
MTAKEFRLLCNTHQINLLYQQGVYVGKRKENEKTVVLYQLDGFYVEIFYREYRKYITKLNCFTSTDSLQPYLKQIDVEELIRCVS